MTYVTTQKQKDNTGRKKGSGPLLSLMMLFCNTDAAAKLFRMVRWTNGLVCPRCSKQNITKYCKYGHFQRYTCKDCNRVFNDKAGTLLHYKRVNLGDWMLAAWMFISGSGNGISINYIAKSIGHTCKATYCTIRCVT